MEILQYIVIFIHLFLVFGNRKWFNAISIFIVVNIVFVFNYVLTTYLLFENAMFKQTGTTNLLQLVIKAYFN